MGTNQASDRAKQPQPLDGDDRYARLRAEATAPYRGLRKFIYAAFATSGLIGAFVFFFQLLAGRDVEAALPNLALQIGVVALMIWLFRIDRQKNRQKNRPSP
jgi:Flp pilus assembly protein TadB